MRLQNIEPHPLLKSYIDKMWLFESNGKMPVDDLKLVVPNGHLKLSVAFRNGIVAKMNGQSFTSKEQKTIMSIIATRLLTFKQKWNEYFS